MKKIKSVVAGIHGYHIIMIDENNDQMEFVSVNQAAKYILSLGLDNIHYRNVGKKIINVLNTDKTVYNCI